MLPRLQIALLAGLAACGGGGGEGKTDGGSATGPRDTLVVAWASDIDSLNPVVSTSANDSEISGQVFASLIDNEFDCSLKKLPAMATEWAWSEDGKTISMTLDTRYKWADGKPVTADDVKFSYELVTDPNVVTARAGYVDRLTPEGRPRIVDDTHIEWQFTEAYDRDTQMSHVTAIPPLPRHILGSADRATLKGHEFSKSPLPSGPWKISKYEPKQRIVLEPNENYTGPEENQPRLQRVVFKIIPEYATRLLELQNGQVDMMQQILVEDADMLRKTSPNVNLVRRGWRSMDYVAWNTKDPKFSDKRVRQALAQSVDINGMIGKLLTSETGEAFARPAVGTITPELCGVHNDDIAPLAYDVTKAKAMFAEAGWTDSNGDGVLDKDGQKFEFTLMTNAENKLRGEAAIRLQSYYKEVGVTMNIERLEFNSMVERLHKRDFEAALGGWSAGLFVDPVDVWHSDPPDRPHEFNYTSYANPKADELIDRGMKTPKPEEAAPIWKELQAVIYDDQPYLFLWWRDEIVGLDKRFEKYEINVLSTLSHLERWEVPADKVKYPR